MDFQNTPPTCMARTRVKICGLTRERDVDAAIAAGCDALGFVLYPKSARAVSVARAAELARRLPPFVTPVLLLVNADAATAAAALQAVPSATLQFHGDESPAECAALAAGAPWIRAARIPRAAHTPDMSKAGFEAGCPPNATAQPPASGSEFDLIEYAARYGQARAILLDALVEGYGGAGHVFDWQRLGHRPVAAHLIASGGLHAHNVGAAIERMRPLATTLSVDVSSGVEAVDVVTGQPQHGIKDAQRMQQFIAAVRQADALLPQPPGRPHTA